MIGKNKVVASQVSSKDQNTIDNEWIATERSDDAEEALLREYHYHLLRVAELKRFLQGCGIICNDE